MAANVKSILDEVRISNIWIYQHPQISAWLSKTVLLKLQDQYKQPWSASISDSLKCLNYRILKTGHKFENYLIRMSPKMRKILIDYRLCNNKLPIETGRWTNIDRNLRKCKLCNSGTVGNEFHYVMECCFFDFYGIPFYHISIRKLLTASHIQIYLMIVY